MTDIQSHISMRWHEVRNSNHLDKLSVIFSSRSVGLCMVLHRDRRTHHHHKCVTERRSQRRLLDTVRVSLLDDHVDLGREDVFV